MAKNVHIEEVSKIRIPSVATMEDRGLKFCKTPIRAVATLDSVDLDKNSRLGLAYKFDVITVELERQRDGVTIPAPGIAVNFPHQSDAIGFIIDWRQLTRSGPGGVELDQGCYRVKVNWTAGIAAGFFYECSINLLQYNNFNTEDHVNMFVVLNDYVKHQGINYKDSGFATTIMFRGQFGYMQPNYLTVNNIYSSDDSRRKVDIKAIRTYELRTNQLLSCVTQQIDERYLLAANQIYITDWNANNHVRGEYVNFPVILSEDESPSFEYNTGVFAKMTAVFKDKQQLFESKYNGDIKGSDNIILELPLLIGSGAECEPDYYLDLFLTATGITDPIIVAALTVFVNELKINNLWNKITALWPFVGGTAATHKYNLKDARDLDEAHRLEFIGTWVHDSDGAASDGIAGSYGDTNYNAEQQNPVRYKHLSGYIQTDLAGGLIGAVQNPADQIVQLGGSLFSSLSGGVLSSAVAADKGLYLVTRDDNTDSRTYINGVLAYTAVGGILGLGNKDLNYYFAARNNDGVADFLMDNPYSLLTIGKAFDATEQAAFDTIVTTFQTALSRNV
jgi:hypothetical protein